VTQRTDIATALRAGGVIDITTTGRTSGQPRRIEIVFFNLDGRVYISGMPGRRAWLANLKADPRLTFHLKRQVVADLPATARVISDETERRPLLTRVCEAWNRQPQTEAFIADSPLIEVLFEDESLLAA
jgi:deazaflavin-dependent oxidoreductase (nitroreductase family)